MNTEVIFRDFERTDSLEQYVLAQTEGLVADFFNDRNSPHIKITIFEDRHRTQDGRRPHYVCEILMSLKGRHQVIKIAKSGYSFFDCVASAGIALRKLVRRTHRYNIDRRTWKDARRAQEEAA